MKCETCRERFAEGFVRGRASVHRENKSGCVCVFDDDLNIISICDAHRQLIEDALVVRESRNPTHPTTWFGEYNDTRL